MLSHSLGKPQCLAFSFFQPARADLKHLDLPTYGSTQRTGMPYSDEWQTSVFHTRQPGQSQTLTALIWVLAGAKCPAFWPAADNCSPGSSSSLQSRRPRPRQPGLGLWGACERCSHLDACPGSGSAFFNAPLKRKTSLSPARGRQSQWYFYQEGKCDQNGPICSLGTVMTKGIATSSVVFEKLKLTHFW